MNAKRVPSIAAFGIAVLLALSAGMAWACTPHAHITIEAETAAPGSSVSVLGNAFPREGTVEIRWGSGSGPLLAAPSGPSFDIRVTIPDAGPGVYYVIAIGRDSQGQVVSGNNAVAPVEVTASTTPDDEGGDPEPTPDGNPVMPPPDNGPVTPPPGGPVAPSPDNGPGVPLPDDAPATPAPEPNHQVPAVGSSPAAPSPNNEPMAPTPNDQPVSRFPDPAGAPVPVDDPSGGTIPRAGVPPAAVPAATGGEQALPDAPAPNEGQSQPRALPHTVSGDLWSGFADGSDVSGASLVDDHPTSSDATPAMALGIGLLAAGSVILFGGAAAATAARRRAKAFAEPRPQSP